jgi:hypothetical protein
MIIEDTRPRPASRSPSPTQPNTSIHFTYQPQSGSSTLLPDGRIGSSSNLIVPAGNSMNLLPLPVHTERSVFFDPHGGQV